MQRTGKDGQLATALDQLSARRFALFLCCLTFRDEPFTTRDLRERLEGPSPALARDLLGLEDAGLLVATPPRTAARQGRPVTYRVAPEAVGLFHALAALVDEAARA